MQVKKEKLQLYEESGRHFRTTSDIAEGFHSAQ